MTGKGIEELKYAMAKEVDALREQALKQVESRGGPDRLSELYRETASCPRNLRSVLEVILKNLRRKGGVHFFSGGLHRPHDLSAANYFCRGKACDLGRQYQIDLQLHVGLERDLPPGTAIRSG